MNQKDIHNHVEILRAELVCALGCTEPIAIAYCAALARAVLKATPTSLSISCSGNIIKNVKSVTVPNSGGMRGIEAAAVLGVLGGDEKRSLEVLESITDQHISHAKELIENGFCSVQLKEGVSNLYVDCTATTANHSARVVIQDRHTNVVKIQRDNKDIDISLLKDILEIQDDTVSTCTEQSLSLNQDKQFNLQQDVPDRSKLSCASIWEFIHEVDIDLIADVINRQITYNSAISHEGLQGKWGARIGQILTQHRPNDIATRAKAAAAAGSDARMSGCPMPVVIVCGSGNQGITTVMPPVVYAQELNCDQETLIRAVALADLCAIHVKHYIGALSAFCGAVSAAAGAGAAVCYLKGGNQKQVEATIVNTLANVGGIVCDGAKASCAAKISASVDAALLGCDMALADDSFLPGDGIVGATCEDTIRSMGYVGRVGMQSTDVEILNIMIGNTICD